MRIDNENKVVWCSEALMEWKESFDDKRIDSILYRIARVGYGYDLEDIYGNRIDYSEYESLTKVGLVKAIVDNYEFKLEQPQKYYWRKKNEHLASFEDEQFLFADEHEKTTVTSIAYASKFYETELMNVIGSVDFNMFERVDLNE